MAGTPDAMTRVMTGVQLPTIRGDRAVRIPEVVSSPAMPRRTPRADDPAPVAVVTAYGMRRMPPAGLLVDVYG